MTKTEDDIFKMMISTANQLEGIFFRNARAQTEANDSKVREGFLVSSKVMRDYYLSVWQGKITLEGRVYTIDFRKVASGIYRASIPDFSRA